MSLVWAVMVAVILMVSCCDAASVVRNKRQTFSCQSDETEIFTPYIFKPTSLNSCTSLISGVADFYNADYRVWCQYHQGGVLPERIANSYVSYCVELNGTSKYRAKVCCEQPPTVQRCFTCQNSAATYDDGSQKTPQYVTDQCNYYGSGVKACAAGEVCMSTVAYPEAGYGIHTKSCASNTVCQNAKTAAKCSSGIGYDPSCVNCCNTPYCNADYPISYLGRQNDVVVGNPCSPNPCAFGGRCSVDSTQTNGFKCDCPAGFFGETCTEDGCTPNPCKNNGFCLTHWESPYYKCGCRAAWRGTLCEIGCNLCNQNTCKNGGTCYDHLAKGDRCFCPEGFIGDDCSIPRPQSCPVAGHVFELADETSGFSSSTCSKQIDDLEKNNAQSFLTFCIYRMATKYGQTNRFVEGVNGHVASTHGASASSCEKGDTSIFYKTSVCCPACLSNPCQNGGWCQQTDDDDYKCKCRYGYGGVNCEFKEGVCYAAGDPHFNTFDGVMKHFQGPCKYLMAGTLTQSGLTPFQVLVRHEHRNGVQTVTYVKYVEILYDGYVIKIDASKAITVDGVSASVGATFPGFNILMNGFFVRVEAVSGLVVESNGDWLVVVKVPDSYKQKVEGLCADFNDNSNNDFVTKEGIDVQTADNRYTVNGNSWQVDDPTDLLCHNNVDEPESCTAEMVATIRNNSFCGLLKDSTSTNPFEKCIKAAHSNAAGFNENCEYDVCVNKDDMKDVACKSLETFASHCRQLGYISDWRKIAGCELICPTNSEYLVSTSACQASCFDPNAASQCGVADTENCVCKAGYVLEDGECITPDRCPCRDSSNNRHEIGSTWLSDDCSTKYSCSACNTCSPVGQITNETNSCAATETCKLIDGAYKCQPNGCTVAGVLREIGSIWQNSDCSTEYKCNVTGVTESARPACKVNEECAMTGVERYTCVAVSCFYPATSTTYKFGDSWKNSDCTIINECKTDGSISEAVYKCTPHHVCERQADVYTCVLITCKDETGKVRQFGSSWTSADCKNTVSCTDTGLQASPTYGCNSNQKCEAGGDLGYCKDTWYWSEWSAWGDCSGSCASGDQHRSRTCVGAGCVGSNVESRSCVCNTQFNVEDCDKCHFVSNVLGYLADACDCNSYIQCEKVNGQWVAYHRPCAPCTQWDQSVVTCVHSTEPCNPIQDTWDEQREDNGEFCTRSGNAKKKNHPTDASKYQWELRPGNWITMPCAPGTYFNQTACDCIHDPNYVRPQTRMITCLKLDFNFLGSSGVWAQGSGVYLQTGLIQNAAYFNGYGRIEIPYFNNRYNYRQFTISLWYKRSASGSGNQGILTNGDCAQSASVLIMSSQSGVSSSISTNDGNAQINPVSAASNTWHHVVLMYNGKRLAMYVDNVIYSSTQTVGGPIEQRHCPLLLGTGGPNMGFTGFIDQVCFYSSALPESEVNNLYREGSPTG